MTVIVLPVPRRPSRWSRLLRRVRYGPRRRPIVKTITSKPVIHRDTGRRERLPLLRGKR